MDYVLGIIADWPVKDRKAVAEKILADIPNEAEDVAPGGVLVVGHQRKSR